MSENPGREDFQTRIKIRKEKLQGNLDSARSHLRDVENRSQEVLKDKFKAVTADVKTLLKAPENSLTINEYIDLLDRNNIGRRSDIFSSLKQPEEFRIENPICDSDIISLAASPKEVTFHAYHNRIPSILSLGITVQILESFNKQIRDKLRDNYRSHLIDRKEVLAASAIVDKMENLVSDLRKHSKLFVVEQEPDILLFRIKNFNELFPDEYTQLVEARKKFISEKYKAETRGEKIEKVSVNLFNTEFNKLWEQGRGRG